MKNFKRVLSVLLICAMIVPLGIFTVNADNISDNWVTMCCKYSNSTTKIIAPKDKVTNKPVIKTDGYTFTEDSATNGGISVVTPDYQTFPGVYGTSAVTSKNKTTLDGLTVVVRPDEFDFAIDSYNASNNISILWCEDEITEIADPENQTGLWAGDLPGTNGLRHLIPVIPGNAEGIPASDSSVSQPTGKALCITVSNAYSEYVDSKTASSVSVVYYDGNYVNSQDHRPGYRWTFTARNTPQTFNQDSSGIKTKYESIVLTYGLVLTIRSDETLGYIININGTDYYEGKKVGYFPDATATGYGARALTDNDYVNKTDAYKNSMTYARKDIDLSGLKGLEGYLTVGASSIKDDMMPNHNCNYTLAYVNGVPASKWTGTAMDPNHQHEYTLIDTIDSTCTTDGAMVYTCSCGASYSDRIDKLGHDWIKDETASYDPTCTEKGFLRRTCSRCPEVDEKVLNAYGHAYDDWFVKTLATPEADGVKAHACVRCGYEETAPYKYSTLDDLYEDWEISGENGYSAIYDGQLVTADINDDNSITINDTSKELDNNSSFAAITKAINKHPVSLNYFNATVTPEALNTTNPDTYPSNMAFILTNNYDKYNYAGEYSCGSKGNQFTGVVSEERYRFGHYWTSPSENEYSIELTLMDFMPLNGEIKGTEGDGYYDIVFYAIVGSGSFWNSAYVVLDNPIKMGDPIVLNTVYEKTDPEDDSSPYALYFGFNADWDEMTNFYNISFAGNSQLTQCAYYFSVAAHSLMAKNPENANESLSASSFTINDICGEDPIAFDGYVDDHVCTPEDEWTVTTEPTCVTKGYKVKYCTYCGLPVEEEEIDATGIHTPGDWTTVKEATHDEEGLEKKLCTVCEEELDSRIIPKVPEDVDVNAWYAEGVEYCLRKGYFGSTSTEKNLFSPYMELTREQLMKVLANVAKVDLSEYTGPSIFRDVPTREWYSSAIKWAGDTGVTSGIGNGLFGLGQKITREQLGVLFMNYVNSFIEEVDHTDTSNLNKFIDASSISGWAKVGLSWAVQQGLLGSTSTTVNRIEPGRIATRAEAARIFMVFDKQYIDIED